MIKYIITSIVSGIMFGFMDVIINANPYAQKLYKVYQPIAKSSVNILTGIIIDLVYGFVMTGLFLVLFKSLPGEFGIVKGISFGLIVWFFRVVMYVASQGMMFRVPINTLVYILVTGLTEMLILGIFYGIVYYDELIIFGNSPI